MQYPEPRTGGNGHGQQRGDCWEEVGIRGLNGKGKNTIKIKVKIKQWQNQNNWSQVGVGNQTFEMGVISVKGKVIFALINCEFHENDYLLYIRHITRISKVRVIF